MSRGIYKIINVINNKFYVGSAVDFTRRKRTHWWMLRTNKHANKHLQAAWNKYGADAFKFLIVEELAESVDILAAENVWLKAHVGKVHCYNVATDATAPATGMFGALNGMYGKTFSHTPEARERIREAGRERKQTTEERAKRIKSMQGHHVAPSTRAKISAALSGDKHPNFGQKRPASMVEKIRKKVCVTRPNGTAILYESIQQLREDLGLKPPTVNRALKSGKPLTRGKFTGWRFEYVGR